MTESDLAVKTVTACRACGAGPLEDLFSLGAQVVSDFVTYAEHRGMPKVPIDLVRCPACTLVQQRFTVPSDLLYRRHYWYRSGTTGTMRRALKNVVDAATARVRLEPNDVWLDVGANDGTLLGIVRETVGPRIFTVGVEPASNLASVCREKADLVVEEFWGTGKWNSFDGSKAKVVTCCGMLYDLDDPTAFVRDVARVLAPDGLFVAQLQCLRQTVALRDVGNYCHEHLEFYTLKSLSDLFRRCGMYVEDVEENAVNGGSYRLYCRRLDFRPLDVIGAERVSDAMEQERDEGLLDPQELKVHGTQLKRSMQNLWQTVESLVRAGKTVWVYGASTKGNVILQAAGIDHRLVKYAADRSPEKVGRYCAGSGILVRSEDDFRRERPDFAICMPYSFEAEFTAREADWRAAGGRWIVPIPEVRVV